MNMLEKCKKFALTKNWKCLSNDYINNYTNLLWQCYKGHQWKAKWTNIQSGKECPECSIYNKKQIIQDLIDFAINKNWILLSNEYLGYEFKYKWLCSEGHQWEASWHNIKCAKTNCPYCVGKLRLDIRELQDFANSKIGLLLSTEYINTNSKVLWKCLVCNNEWWAKWNHVKNGSWCPQCSLYKTEKICKKILEQKLNIKFNKTRFYYENQRLEFDGYSQEHQMAFEYHGYQHYEYPNCYHRTPGEFNKQNKRDDLKEQFCIENNIRLIIIPYTEANNLEKYISKLIGEYV